MSHREEEEKVEWEGERRRATSTPLVTAEKNRRKAKGGKEVNTLYINVYTCTHPSVELKNCAKRRAVSSSSDTPIEPHNRTNSSKTKSRISQVL